MTQVVQYHCDRCGLVEDMTTLRWCWLRVKPSGPASPPTPAYSGNAGGTRRLELCPACEQALIRFLKESKP